MELDLGAKVNTLDRRDAGKVTRAVIDPDTRQVVDIIIHRKKGIFEARDIVVPARRAESREGEIELQMAEAELDQLPDFAERDYLPVPEQWFDANQFPLGSLLRPAGIPATVLAEQEVQNVPAGTIDLTEGMAVVCPDGAVGSVDELVYDPASGELKGIVIHRGAIARDDVFIPTDWIAGVKGDRVILNRTKAEIERLKERHVG